MVLSNPSIVDLPNNNLYKIISTTSIFIMSVTTLALIFAFLFVKFKCKFYPFIPSIHSTLDSHILY
jgi:hypothetical protein